MSVHAIPPDQAHRLLPLLHQVHDLHLAHHPDRYAVLPDDPQMSAHLKSWLSMPDVYALGVARDDHLLGYLIYEIERRAATPFRVSETRAMIHHICVDAAHRKKGIGLSLLHEVRKRAVEAGADVLATTYAEFNTASAKLMSRAGLSPVMRFAEWRTDQ